MWNVFNIYRQLAFDKYVKGAKLKMMGDRYVVYMK